MRHKGIVVLPEYVPKDVCRENGELIKNFAKSFSTSTKLESGTFIAFRTEVGNDNADQGMIDIIGIDKELTELEHQDLLPSLERIVSRATAVEMKCWSINAYVNQGVVNTRDYHVDDFTTNYKAFVYLTNVRDEADGPYSYIPGSNSFYIPKYLNLYRNLLLSHKHRIPDMPKFFPRRNAIHCLGDIGTVVISDQAGIHRGLPQERNRERIVLVFNFMDVKKANIRKIQKQGAEKLWDKVQKSSGKT